MFDLGADEDKIESVNNNAVGGSQKKRLSQQERKGGQYYVCYMLMSIHLALVVTSYCNV
jgi:hypothetical protein